jgi:hypothetical protein
MGLKEFVKTIFKTSNPFSAKYLVVEKKLIDAFIFFFLLLFLTLLITTLLYIPKIIKYPDYVQDKISKFDNLSIIFNGEMNSPLTISEKPLVVIDTSRNNITNETILVSEGKTFFKWFFIKKEYNASHTNILDSPEKIKKFIILMTVLLAPVIWFALYIYLGMKYLLIILIAILVALIALKIAKRDIKFNLLLKAGIYSSTLMILLDLIPKPFINLRFIPILIFAGLFTITAWMVSQEKGEKKGFDIRVKEKEKVKEQQLKKSKKESDIGFEKY